MRDNILSEIKAAVAAQAKAAGYSLVIDAAAETANATTAVVYSNGENDLTDAVLKRLNAGAPIGTTPRSGCDLTVVVAGHQHAGCQLALSRCTGFSKSSRCDSSKIPGIRPANGLFRSTARRSSSRTLAAFSPGNQCSACPSKL